MITLQKRNGSLILDVNGCHVVRAGKMGMADFTLFSLSLFTPEFGNILTLHLGVFFLEINYGDA